MDSILDTEKHVGYIGNELQLFKIAVNWKSYLASRLQPFIKGDVLDVGTGLGSNIPYIYHGDLTRWVSLEPDKAMHSRLLGMRSEGRIPVTCELIHGKLEALPSSATFDSILYIDVLEHIEDDRREFNLAYQHLNPGGHLVVLCPAHNLLFSPFDKAIGHFRRYNKGMYRRLTNQQALKMEYLDSVGVLASIMNKLLFRQTYPSERQIKLWDRLFVRLSTVIDPMSFRMVGKSLLGVWKK